MADTAQAASESDGCLNPENKSEMETPNSSGDENSETKQEGTNISEDPFKKPAIFAAPSVALKKSKSVQKIKPEADSGVITKDQPEPETSDRKEPSKESTVNDDQSFKHDTESRNQIPVTEKLLTKEKQITATPKPNIKPQKRAKVPPSAKFPPLPYIQPPWAGIPGVPYTFELLKNGSILDTVPLSQQSYFVVGRIPVCDISLEHPSISRYHAIVQYRGNAGDTVGEALGFYIYDLGSTHGTFVNKNKIPPKTYIRLHVGHVLKFGGSTRLFILQGPESDEEDESELTVTELRERARKHREELEKKMMGDGSDDDIDDDDDKEEKNEESVAHGRSAANDSGCSWGMGEDSAPEEDENEENPFATEFQEDQEAAYLKDPKKALQGFYDREGEELEFEYDDKGHGTWLCRIKLPVDDAMGKQLVAEVTHSGRKKEAAVQCCLEACRMLEARGLLRQEAVSRKRKKKNWEEDDYYDSDDDSFLDRTGTVERKRKERMKKAGKIQERPETYDSLVAKLAEVEKELAKTENTLSSSEKGGSSSATEDPLDAFMSGVRSQAAVDVVQRKKLHLHVAELKKEAQRLQKLIDLTRPTQLPSLQSQPGNQSESDKPKKLTLPLFGAMKGGRKFKLKTGAIGKLPPKRPNLPPELFNMKELPPEGEEEEEEEDEQGEKASEMDKECNVEEKESIAASEVDLEPAPADEMEHVEVSSAGKRAEETCSRSPKGKDQPPLKKSGKMIGPSRPPSTVSKQYPEDDPDYCVWVPPAGQSGDGRTHLNDKYGY